MRRIEIEKAANDIQDNLKISQILKITTTLTRTRKVENAEHLKSEVLSAFKKYAINAASYGEAAKELTRILGLEFLEDPAVWARIMTVTDGEKVAPKDLNFVHHIRSAINFAVSILPRITKMIQQKSKIDYLKGKELQNQTFKEKELLSVIILEETNQYSTPKRLCLMLESVSMLYEVCAAVNGLPADELSVIALDSGSDKLFDFLGVAKIIETVKEVIISLWDKIVFYREKKFEVRLELVAQAIPVIDQIGELEKNKKIGNEQAESLKRRIIESSTKFVKSGAMIPEIENEAKQNPRQLLAPEPKLLAAPLEDFDRKDSPSNDSPKPAKSDTGLNNFTASDQTLLRAFKKSAEKKETGKGKEK